MPLLPKRPTHNLYGMTGLIDMPSAEMQPDAQLSVTSSYFSGYLRNTVSAQALPGFEVALRYSVLDKLFGGTLYDRSFDLKLRMVDEGPGWPSVVLGLQDFLGTGVYSGEYLAVTKSLLDGDLKVTGGIGWGRFAGRSGVSNPLCWNGNRFCSRNDSTATGGTVNFGQLFSGRDMGIFGGLEWQTPIDGLSLKAEYSDDPYTREKQSGAFDPRLPLNFGLTYQPIEGVEVGAYYMYGAELGIHLTLSVNPFHPSAESDDERPARPVQRRPIPDATAAASQFGKIRDMVTGAPPSTRFADTGVGDVTVETKAGGVRLAKATILQPKDKACPDEAATAIDAQYGMIDAVTFLDAGGKTICTVALRPAGQRMIERDVAARVTYSTDWYDDEEQRQKIAEALAADLDPALIGLLGIELKPKSVAVYIENKHFRSMPRAIGRTARALTATMPPSVALFEIVPVEAGLPVVSVMLQRAALEDDINRPGAARSSWLSARVADAPVPNWDAAGALAHFPRTFWAFSPYTPFSLFDPGQPIRFDVSMLAAGGIEFLPGLSVNGAVSKRLFGTLADIKRESDSELPHVRSDIASYLKDGDPAVQRLTADYVTKIDSDLYGRVSTGLLEPMYGGVSGELLWKPARQSWAIGGELNWVKQRDYDQRFSFRGYDVVTGHASLYWDTGWYGVSTEVDAGRYLAGDWGATFTLKRRFSNGWEIGAFATFTDVPFSKFGEGSFDKGIFLTIPFNWFLPFESRLNYSPVIRSLTRDGGQRLSIANRLYPIVEDTGREELRGSWQDFWK